MFSFSLSNFDISVGFTEPYNSLFSVTSFLIAIVLFLLVPNSASAYHTETQTPYGISIAADDTDGKVTVTWQESDGYEWIVFKGANWYRSLTIPGPWTRHGATQQNHENTQQNSGYSDQQQKGQTVIQNITYNIQDSAISGDINADINRRNET